MELINIIKSSKFRFGNALFWFGLFLLNWLLSFLEVEETTLNAIIYNPGAYYLVLWLLSPLICTYFLSTYNLSGRKQVVLHTLAALGFGVFHFFLTGVFTLVLERLFLLEEHYTLSSLLMHYVNNWYLIFDGIGWYIIYLTVISLLHYYILYQNEKKRVIATESNLANSNFQVLSTQLSPHFLFNAMNSIAMMVRKKENKQAVSMIASLSEMLRVAMSQKNDQLVTLKSELELLEKYLTIETARFKDLVQVNLSFPEETLLAQVPQLVLQPLVENAFKHGVANSMERVKIEVNAKKDNQKLILSVYNSGQSEMHWDINNSKSLGLPNTVHRLRQLYNNNFNFKVIEQQEGILFQVTVPFSTIQPNQ